MKMAGMEVHKKVLMAVVVDASAPEEKPARRRFATLPTDLHRLLTWLREQGVEEAVMESTAQENRLQGYTGRYGTSALQFCGRSRWTISPVRCRDRFTRQSLWNNS